MMKYTLSIFMLLIAGTALAQYPNSSPYSRRGTSTFENYLQMHRNMSPEERRYRELKREIEKVNKYLNGDRSQNYYRSAPMSDEEYKMRMKAAFAVGGMGSPFEDENGNEIIFDQKDDPQTRRYKMATKAAFAIGGMGSPFEVEKDKVTIAKKTGPGIGPDGEFEKNENGVLTDAGLRMLLQKMKNSGGINTGTQTMGNWNR
jgi:hypothetical protein